MHGWRGKRGILPACLRVFWPAVSPRRLRHDAPQNETPCAASPSLLACLQVKRVLATQLPPRAFLAYWCGGLSVGEGLGVLAW